MAQKPEKSSLRGLLFVLVAIVSGVVAVVYALENHRKHMYHEKWKDYDECGLS